MIKLIGIVIVAVGFACRINTLLVVVVAGLASGLVAGMSFNDVVAQFGAAFVENRYMTLPVVLMLPLIGTLEHHGLRERAEMLIRRARAATAGRVLLVYSAARQIAISLGVRIGDHASAVRPLVAPMAEAAAVRQLAIRSAVAAARDRGGLKTRNGSGTTVTAGNPAGVSDPRYTQSSAAGETAATGDLPLELVHTIRAHAAAAENVGNFFGEDIFIAVGAVLLMNGFFQSVGMDVSMMALALWGIPTAVFAFLLMWWRVHVLDRRIAAYARP